MNETHNKPKPNGIRPTRQWLLGSWLVNLLTVDFKLLYCPAMPKRAIETRQTKCLPKTSMRTDVRQQPAGDLSEPNRLLRSESRNPVIVPINHQATLITCIPSLDRPRRSATLASSHRHCDKYKENRRYFPVVSKRYVWTDASQYCFTTNTLAW